MTDRVHPSTKPIKAATAAAPPAPAKTHLNNPTRHPYRPTPAQHHHLKKHREFSCRRCFCLTCLWSILLLIAILLLAAIAAAAFYVLYRPHRPAFSVTSLRISAFNLTTAAADDTTHLTTKINLTMSAKNPNKKAVFTYDPVAITVLSDSVTLSNGSFANFTSGPGSIFVIHTAMGPNSQVLDADSVNSLKSDMKRKNGLPIIIVMDTMVGVKLEKHKVKKIGIRVRCEGIHGVVPKGKKVISVMANTANAKCTVDLRIKILKWTF